MTGGSSRITMVQDKVKEFFKGKELNTSINVDEAVAYGAAIQAAILFGDTSKKLSGIVLKDVTPLALGIETGFGDMTTVVKRNTRIPFTISRTFTTRYDYQTAATFSVYEGERAMVKDNNQLGVFQLENIPRALRGVPQLASIFDMDSNGILSVTATETVQGSCGKITLKQDGRLSVVQIDERLLIEKRMKQEDDKVRAAQKARNDLEAYVYQVKRNIASSNVSIKKLNKCTEILDWLKQAALTEKEKSTVMMLLAIADPNGTAQTKQHKLQRRIYQNKGPNWCWHMDGYDKLKPFGFPIHACIDGADCGTENVVAALCQMVLRHEHPDTNAGKYSFLFGSSIKNSRIEVGGLSLENQEVIGGSTFSSHIAGFVFLPLLRKELDEFKKRWNRHKIRNNRLASCPNGAPDDLYYLSAYQGIGAENCTRMISPDCLARLHRKI
eukprot:Em0003g1020a